MLLGMDNKEYVGFQEVCIKTALEAGVLLNHASKKAQQIKFQDEKDIKLKADEDTEVLIRESLTLHSNTPIIGEEKGGDPSLLQSDVLYWVVDPLDGTYNFLRNQPATCVSIGLMRGTTHILGVVYDFISDNMYVGGVHSPMSCNGRVIQPKWSEDLSKSCLMTGFPAGRDYSQSSLEAFIKDIQRFKKIRMIGSAALALAYVSMGYADAYYEEGIRLWDVAAGAALVESAGGHVSITPLQNGLDLSYKVWAVGRKEWL